MIDKVIKNENTITVYHGSDKIIEKPEFGKGHVYNDYGKGFYLTLNKDLAGEWAVLRTGSNGYINEYELDSTALNILAILIKNRDIDFAEVYSYMRGFITGVITKEAVAKLFNLGDWGVQICLKSEKAFDNITLTGYTEAASEKYYKNALDRNQTAGNLYRKVDGKILREGNFIIDLI